MMRFRLDIYSLVHTKALQTPNQKKRIGAGKCGFGSMCPDGGLYVLSARALFGRWKESTFNNKILVLPHLRIISCRTPSYLLSFHITHNIPNNFYIYNNHFGIIDTFIYYLF